MSDRTTASRRVPSKVHFDDQSSHHISVSSIANRGSTGRGDSRSDGNQVRTNGTRSPVETVNVENADYIELMPQFERTGGRSVRFVSDDYPTMLRAFIVATRISAGANVVV